MRKLVILLFLAALLIAASVPAFAQDSSMGYVRIAHLSSGGTIVVFVDGSPRLSGLRYQAFTRWIDFEPGSYEIAISNNSSIGGAFFTETVEVTAGSYTTIAVYGTDTRAAIALPEDLNVPEGQARVNVFHGIQGATPVDVLANGSAAISLLAYPRTVVNNDTGSLNDGFTSVDVPAGTYDLAVTANGAPGTVLLDLAGTELAANTSYFVAAVGSPDAPDVVINATDLAELMGTDEEAATEEAGEEAAATEETASTDEAATPTASLAEIAISNPDFTTLLAAVQAADPSILAALTSGDEYTVFAPTNAAFEKTLVELGLTAADVLGNQELLTSILQYHVVRGTLTSDRLLESGELVTLQGAAIKFQKNADGTITLNDTVTVVMADVLATDGVIHVIDGVLIPPTEE